MRRNDVAQAAGVAPAQVQQVDASEVRKALADRVSSVVLDVATQQPAIYWRASNRYFLDDPYFGDVVEVTDLNYDSELGLHVRQR